LHERLDGGHVCDGKQVEGFDERDDRAVVLEQQRGEDVLLRVVWGRGVRWGTRFRLFRVGLTLAVRPVTRPASSRRISSPSASGVSFEAARDVTSLEVLRRPATSPVIHLAVSTASAPLATQRSKNSATSASSVRMRAVAASTA